MYKRIFFSELTATIAFISILVFIAGDCVAKSVAGYLNRFDCFDIAAQLAFSVFLFFGYRKHNLMAMQGGCSGLLVSVVYSQAVYVLNDLLSLGFETFVDLGFWGSFYLAGQLMLLILEVILMISHFVLFILKKRNFIQISLNQVVIIIMLAFLLLQMFVVSRITAEWRVIASMSVINLRALGIYILIACAELILALDAGSGGE